MRLYELLFEGIEEKVAHIARSMGEKIENAAGHDHSAKDLLGQFDVPGQQQARVGVTAILRKLAEADPTGDRADALLWIVRMYAAGEFYIEDLPRLRNDLTKFFKYRSAIQNRDLNSYKTLDQLYDTVEAVEDGEGIVSGKQAAKQAKVEGAEKVIETPDLSVVKLLTAAAANIYGKGTKWCTTSENGGHFAGYSQQGPLYAIIVNHNGMQRKFQFHYESEQFMDERDRPIKDQDIALLSSYDGYTQFLNLMIKQHYSQYFDNK